MFVIHARREIEAGLAEKSLHEGRAEEGALAGQQVFPAPPPGLLQSDERAHQFTQ